VEEKVRRYVELSDGKIRVALHIHLEEDFYDMANDMASVSVLASDGASSHWVQHAEIFYVGVDDGDLDLDQQPNGHVGLYVSDFCGPAGLPTALCRPSAAELAAGISRAPQILLVYERLAAIFRAALATEYPTVSCHRIKDSEQVENLFELLAKKRLAGIKARVEMERRVVIARKEGRKEEGFKMRRQLAAFKRRMNRLLEAAARF